MEKTQTKQSLSLPGFKSGRRFLATAPGTDKRSVAAPMNLNRQGEISEITAKTPWWPYLLLTLTALFWAGNFVMGRGIRQIIPPVSLNFWRWAGALLILLPFGWPRIKSQWPIIKTHWLWIAWMSVPSITIFNAFIYTALQHTTTTNTVLINAQVPVFIAGASIFWGERLRLRQLCGVLVSMFGLVFIITRGDVTMLGTLAFSHGDLWTLGAGICWAIYSVCLRNRPPALDPLAFLTLLVAFGLLFELPFYLWELSVKGGFGLSVKSLGGIAYACIFPSVLAYIFWNRGVAMVGANRAGIFFHLMPVFAILLAVIFLNERLFLFHVAGMGLIFGGIALTTWPVRRN